MTKPFIAARIDKIHMNAHINTNRTIGVDVKTKLNSQIGIPVIFAALFSNGLCAEVFQTKEKIEFSNEFRFFIEGALHKGTDNTKNIPLYDRVDDVFYSGVGIAVVGNYTGTAQNQIYRDEIEAGGYYRGSFGAEFPVAENLTFSFSAGFLYDEITGDLADGSGGDGFASFRTTIVDFIGFYNLGRHRFGLGGSFHYNPKFDYKEIGTDFQNHGVYRFSNALGATFQYDYLLSKNISMGIRYTDISYDFDEVRIGDYVDGIGNSFVEQCIASCDDLVDASSFSGHVTYRF